MAKKIWLDCDPGHDDAIAILLALGSPDVVRLVGISAVSGNQSLEKTYRNAQLIARLVGHNDLPIIAGMARPITRPERHDPSIHGESGIDGSPTLTAFAQRLDDEGSLHKLSQNPTGKMDQSNLSFSSPPGKRLEEIIVAMVSSVSLGSTSCDCETDKDHEQRQNNEKLTFVATGALTNLAMLIRLFPREMMKSVNEIVLMGGAIGIGNMTPGAEFNILCDPEAARIVFDNELDLPVTMVPLEVTHTAILTEQLLQEIVTDFGQSNFAQIFSDLVCFFRSTYKKKFGFHDGPPIHDACAVMYVMKPELFETRQMRVDVMLGEDDDLSVGRTVCDVWDSVWMATSTRPKNVFVCERMDVGEFWKEMIRALACCNEKSVLN